MTFRAAMAVALLFTGSVAGVACTTDRSAVPTSTTVAADRPVGSKLANEIGCQGTTAGQSAPDAGLAEAPTSCRRGSHEYALIQVYGPSGTAKAVADLREMCSHSMPGPVFAVWSDRWLVLTEAASEMSRIADALGGTAGPPECH